MPTPKKKTTTTKPVKRNLFNSNAKSNANKPKPYKQVPAAFNNKTVVSVNFSLKENMDADISINGDFNYMLKALAKVKRSQSNFPSFIGMPINLK